MMSIKKGATVDEFIDDLHDKHLIVHNHLPARADCIIKKLWRYNIHTDIVTVDVEAYHEWMTRADYGRYSDYIPLNKTALLSAKSMQHYLAAHFLNMQEGQNYLDVASNRSIAADIYKRLYNLSQVWIQDLTFEPGINGNYIGSDASAIPLDNESIDYIALHCAFEHFEGNRDVLFMHEASRLLCSGGKLCIVPLYLSETYHLLTSTFAWKRFKRYPQFQHNENAVIFFLDEERASKYYDTMFWRRYDVDQLVQRIINQVKLWFNIKVICYMNWKAVPGCPQFMLLMEKL